MSGLSFGSCSIVALGGFANLRLVLLCLLRLASSWRCTLILSAPSQDECHWLSDLAQLASAITFNVQDVRVLVWTPVPHSQSQALGTCLTDDGGAAPTVLNSSGNESDSAITSLAETNELQHRANITRWNSQGDVDLRFSIAAGDALGLALQYGSRFKALSG